MPGYAPATIESLEEVQEVLKQFIPSSIQRHRFWKSLQGRLNLDYRGRVSFRPHITRSRRIAVKEIFDGTNYEEVAKTLGETVETVRNDVRWNYANGHKNGNGKVKKK